MPHDALCRRHLSGDHVVTTYKSATSHMVNLIKETSFDRKYFLTTSSSKIQITLI